MGGKSPRRLVERTGKSVPNVLVEGELWDWNAKDFVGRWAAFVPEYVAGVNDSGEADGCVDVFGPHYALTVRGSRRAWERALWGNVKEERS